MRRGTIACDVCMVIVEMQMHDSRDGPQRSNYKTPAGWRAGGGKDYCPDCDAPRKAERDRKARLRRENQ